MKLWKSFVALLKELLRARTCNDCAYKRKWGCSASCGNDNGVVCGAYFKRAEGGGHA